MCGCKLFFMNNNLHSYQKFKKLEKTKKPTLKLDDYRKGFYFNNINKVKINYKKITRNNERVNGGLNYSYMKSCFNCGQIENIISIGISKRFSKTNYYGKKVLRFRT